jgi:putative ABC transport system permease protein
VRRRPSRTLAAATSVAVGVAAVLATLSLGDNVQANLSAELQRSALGGDVRVVAAAGERTLFETGSLPATLTADPAVTGVTTRLEMPAEPRTPGGDEPASSWVPGFESGFMLVGLERPNHAEPVGRLAAGRWPSPDAAEVALAQAFVNARGFDLSDTLVFATPYGPITLEVVGVLEDGRGAAVLNQGRIGMVERSTLAQALGLGGRATQLDVRLTDREEQAVQAALIHLEGILPARLIALRASAPTGGAGGLLETLEAGLQVLAVMLTVLGSFMAYNTFAASSLDRRHELRLLRTVCLSRGDVRALALWEAGMTALVGVAMGLTLGLVLTWLLAALNAVVLGFTVRTLTVSPAAVMLSAFAGVASGMVAAWRPAQEASLQAPLGVQTQVQAAASPARRVLIWLAVGLVAALVPAAGWVALVAGGAALVALGVTLSAGGLVLVPRLAGTLQRRSPASWTEARLLGGFMERNVERNGVAMATVAVGVGLVLGVAAMMSSINVEVRQWVNATIAGDLFVTSPSGFPEDFKGRSEAQPGVLAASPVAVRVVRAEGPGGQQRSVNAVFVEPERYQSNLDLGGFVTPDGRADDGSLSAALAAGDVLVSEVLQRRLNLPPGSMLELRTLSGYAPFRVAGTVVDFTGGGDSLVLPYEALERFGGGRANVFVIGLQPNVRADGARERLQACLLVLALILAGLGVTNALAMNLNARSHEWAVLRALGMTRSRAVRLAALEGLLITTLGVTFGAAFGVMLSRLVAQGASAITGFSLTPTVPFTVLAWVLVGAIPLGVMASVWPAIRVARVSPARAFDAKELGQ